MATSGSSNTGKRGRPATTGTGQTIGVRMLPPALAAVDAWIAELPEPQPTRPDAIRQLVDMGLAAHRQHRADKKASASEARKADEAQARLDYAKARDNETIKTQRLRHVRLAKE